MESTVQRALLNILIHAALVDGDKSEIERNTIRDVAESLATGAQGAVLAGVYQDVLLRRVPLAQAIAALATLEHRQLAYELAVCVCDSDGAQSTAERDFLIRLRNALALETDVESADNAAQADAIASAAVLPPVVPKAATPSPTAAASPSNAELDKSILNYSILNGALELLPQSWASMAIIPLQVRMVYKIGLAHGVKMDQGHIKEFLATVGVGLTSQYIEQVGRKLLGGLVGKAAGKMLGGVASAATGMAFSFATTYALGQVAKRYYAGGRVMSTELLRRTFQELLVPAKQMQQEYLPAIRQRASTLNPAEVVQLVRQ